MKTTNREKIMAMYNGCVAAGIMAEIDKTYIWHNDKNYSAPCVKLPMERKRGNEVIYKLNNDKLVKLLESLKSLFDYSFKMEITRYSMIYAPEINFKK